MDLTKAQAQFSHAKAVECKEDRQIWHLECADTLSGRKDGTAGDGDGMIWAIGAGSD